MSLNVASLLKMRCWHQERQQLAGSSKNLILQKRHTY